MPEQGTRCVICSADFRSDALVNGKCVICAGAYPDATCLEDIKDPNKERAHLMNEPIIRELIYEILEEAGLRRKRCETCKTLFFPRSPAAKFCDSCRSKKAEPVIKESD
jgi:hypothetical protein